MELRAFFDKIKSGITRETKFDRYEYGMTGGPDPDCRRGMLWDENLQNKDVYAWYRRLVEIRKAYPCLTEGTIVHTICDDETGFFAVTREWNESRITLLVHAKEGVCGARAFLQEEIGKGAKDLLTDKVFSGELGSYEIVVIG